jgi:fumarate reductase subunit C
MSHKHITFLTFLKNSTMVVVELVTLGLDAYSIMAAHTANNHMFDTLRAQQAKNRAKHPNL